MNIRMILLIYIVLVLTRPGNFFFWHSRRRRRRECRLVRPETRANSRERNSLLPPKKEIATVKRSRKSHVAKRAWLR